MKEVTDFSYDLGLIAADDPYPTYKWMRDHDPAHDSPAEGIWVLTRFEDVASAFKDWRTWSSQRRGNLVHDMPERIGNTLGTTDPPEHSFARGLIDKAFTPRTVEEFRPRIADLSKQLVAGIRDEKEFEFVNRISAPLNAAILGSMFGVPETDFIRLRHWLDDFFLREAAREGEEPKQVVAMHALLEYADTLVEERMVTPTQDLLSKILLTEEDGQRLTREQVVITTTTFLTAGFESVNNLFTNLIHALAVHPEALEELRSDPELIPAFVEECMRWDAPAQGFIRTPTRDVELHGKTIPENAEVLMHIGSANRDERQFDDADRLDLHRPKQRHLGFGLGIHFCVGAPLGRLMAQILIGELVRVSDGIWEIDSSRAVRVTTPNFRGFSKLVVKI